MIEDERPAVDDVTSVAQELIDLYAMDEGQIIGGDVTAVTSKYDEVKRAAHALLRQLNEALQPTDVSVASTE